MRKFVTLVGMTILSAGTLLAQSVGGVTGKLLDAESKAAIIGAVIEVSPVNNPDAKKHYTTEGDGAVNVRQLDYGQYKFTFSYLGYKTLERTVRVNNETVSLGTLLMETEALAIDKVTLEVPAMRTSVKGDTVSYNADAFKVAADADTEGLLAKMPGITIAGGTVEAQGEEVKKVLVDGREFFGDDVTSAIRNLPAEVVDRIEVYNKLSDQAEFTGIDDGEGYKAINIVTKQDKRSGQFGKLYGAWGVHRNNATGKQEFDKYIAGGNVNLFQGSSRISLIGLANNLNQQNFSFEDIIGVVNTGGSSSAGGRMGRGGGGGVRGFMVRPQEGIANVQSIGINYSDQWGKKVQFTGSYFFNHTNTKNYNNTEEWFYNTRGTIDYTSSESNSEIGNYNHRFNARVDYKINDNHNLMIRPSFSFQGNDNYSFGSATYDEITDLGNDIRDQVKKQTSRSNSDRSGYNAGLNLLYRVKLGKPGRTITVNMDGSYRNNEQFGFPDQRIFYPPYSEGQVPDSLIIQRIVADNNSYRLRGGVTYTEPLSERSSLNLEYNINYNFSDNDRKVHLLLDEAVSLNAFNPNFDPTLSNIYNSGYLTQRVSPGYRYNSQKFNFNANVTYENARLSREQEYPATTADARPHYFNNLLYGGMLNANFNPANSLRLHAHSYTNNPSVTQLQKVLDLTNRDRVYEGNPDLVPSYSNRIMMYYINSNAAKGRTFSVGVGGVIENNTIANKVITNPTYEMSNGEMLGKGNRYTTYENLDGKWSLWTGISYGMPVKFLRSNLNLDLGGNFGQTPTINDDVLTKTTDTFYNAGVTLGSNISEKIDFTLSWRGSYNVSRNNMSTRTPETRFINHVATASVKWVTWKDITFSGNIAYNQDKGLSEDYNEEYVLCNIFVGKKIFRNKRGELSLGVNDLFNQNTSFRRNITANRITNTTNSVIGRYFSVQFIYNLRNFGKKASRDSKDYDGLDREGNGSVGIQRGGGGTRSMGPGGPGGPPPGGFR